MKNEKAKRKEDRNTEAQNHEAVAASAAVHPVHRSSPLTASEPPAAVRCHHVCDEEEPWEKESMRQKESARERETGIELYVQREQERCAAALKKGMRKI